MGEKLLMHDLMGCWFCRLKPRAGSAPELEGVVRFKTRKDSQGWVHISGDLYEVGRESQYPDIPAEDWFPVFPHTKYKWYFLIREEPRFGREIPLQAINWAGGGFWDEVGGTLLLKNESGPTGQLEINNQTWTLEMTRASPFLRGCVLHVYYVDDVPREHQFSHDSLKKIREVYDAAGFELEVKVSNQNRYEMRDPLPVILDNRVPHNHANKWNLHLIITGTRMPHESGYYGLMFDETGAHREGVALFTDKLLFEIPQGKIPEALLRTALHEVGHGFNLQHFSRCGKFHPTLMRTNKEIKRRFGSLAEFKENISLVFDWPNLLHLAHGPDCLVKPGWGNWRFGCKVTDIGVFRGSCRQCRKRKRDKMLNIALKPGSSSYQVDDYITLEVRVTNKGIMPRLVPQQLDMAGGNLTFDIIRETEKERRKFSNVGEAVKACRDRSYRDLGCGEHIQTVVQLSYTDVGYIFREPGTYRIKAILESRKGFWDKWAESEELVIKVNQPADVDEKSQIPHPSKNLLEMSAERGVGLGFTFGRVFGENTKKTVREMIDTEPRVAGLAHSLILANSNEDNSQSSDEYIRVLGDGIRTIGVLQTVHIAVSLVRPFDCSSPILEKLSEILDKTEMSPEKKIAAFDLLE